MTTFRSRLKSLMGEREIETAAALSWETKLQERTIRRWLAGTQEPQLAQLRGLARFFGVSIDYLAGGTEVRTPAPVTPPEGLADRARQASRPPRSTTDEATG